MYLETQSPHKPPVNSESPAPWIYCFRVFARNLMTLTQEDLQAGFPLSLLPSLQNIKLGTVSSRMPRRVPQLLIGIARRGAAWMPHVAEGAGSPFRRPRSKARSAGNKRHPGVFSFGYFSLDKQRKVSRLSVREPTLKQSSR